MAVPGPKTDYITGSTTRDSIVATVLYMNGQGRFKLNHRVFFALFSSFSLFFDIFRSFSNLFAHFLTKLLVTCESPYRFRSFSDQSIVTLCLLVFVCVAEPYNYLIFSVLFCLNESIFIATNRPLGCEGPERLLNRR